MRLHAVIPALALAVGGCSVTVFTGAGASCPLHRACAGGHAVAHPTPPPPAPPARVASHPAAVPSPEVPSPAAPRRPSATLPGGSGGQAGATPRTALPAPPRRAELGRFPIGTVASAVPGSEGDGPGTGGAPPVVQQPPLRLGPLPPRAVRPADPRPPVL